MFIFTITVALFFPVCAMADDQEGDDGALNSDVSGSGYSAVLYDNKNGFLLLK